MSSQCPICDAPVTLPEKAEESEIISCTDCQTKLVIEKIQNENAILAQAPAVEEDWGE
ncbi:MAG: lysine biosynthesis protein LysW [bacterium]|nr:lysine biosynthesis protein LysW [bacterium]